VTDAALFLIWRSTRNWALGLARRLRSPRYAIAVLVGVAYVALVFVGQRQGASGAIPVASLRIGGSLFLAVLILKWWLFGADRQALAFTPAEIHFLFPAPVPRAALLGYKLISAQRLIVVNVLVWALLIRRSDDSLGTLPYAISLWVFFSTLFFHRLAVALTRDSVAEHRGAGLRRAWPAGVVLAIIAGGAWVALRHVTVADLSQHPGGPLGAFRLLLETPPLSWILWPFQIPLLPLGASGLGDWALRLLPALALVALHVVWIVRADRAFEDAAIDASARRARRLERWKRYGAAGAPLTHRVRRWLPLGATGHPVGAIVWKNITRLVRTVSPALPLTVGVLLTLAIGLGVAAENQSGAVLTMVATLTLGWAGALAVFGPQWVRNDLRGELEHLSMLRTWPLSGSVIVTGQVLSSTLVLTALQLGLGGAGVVALLLSGQLLVAVPEASVLGLVALLLLFGLNLVSLALQNGAALLYPTWVRTELRPGGIEQMGQRLLTAGASLLLLLLAALGPGLIGGILGYGLWHSLGLWALAPAGILAAAGLGLEAFLILDWSGGRFEKTDPTAL
jgi:hypothetical protein